MRLFLLGSTGLLGQAITRFANNQNIEVYGVARSGSDFSIDLTDETLVKNVFNEVQPTLVINAAALTNLEECEKAPLYAKKLNADLPALISKLCFKSLVKFVHISTDHFYGAENYSHSEDESVDLLNEYARTKYLAESCLNHDRDLIIRTNIVGFRGWASNPTFVEWVIENLVKNNQIVGFQDVFISSINVNLFVEYLFDLINTESTGVVNLASRNHCSKYDFILKLAVSLGLDSNQVKPGALNQISKIQRSKHMGLDVSKAERLLNKRLPSIDETISTIALDYNNLK